MWLILLLYFLMASTFTIGKTALHYMQPIYFIAFRMLIAGCLLLAYVVLGKKGTRIARADRGLYGAIIAFHIYGAYVLEFWALQYISSAKACLLYNLSPFITALFSYIFFGHRLCASKWVGMLIGFAAMIPVLITNDMVVSSYLFSGAEIALLLAICCAAYGWIVMKKLIDRGYSPLQINGVGMLAGGAFALVTALLTEGIHPLLSTDFLEWPDNAIMASLCMAFLIIVANGIGYNLYGFLLNRYSPTFLSFAGFITPFFAGIFGWLFLQEPLTVGFMISFVMTIIGLYVFYHAEIVQ